MLRKEIGSKLQYDFTAYVKTKCIYNYYLIAMYGESAEIFYNKLGYNSITDLCTMRKNTKGNP